VQNHLDQLLVHAGQIDGGSERDAARLLQLEVDVRRMLVQPDSDAFLYTEHNDQKLSLNSNQLVVKIVINIWNLDYFFSTTQQNRHLRQLKIAMLWRATFKQTNDFVGNVQLQKSTYQKVNLLKTSTRALWSFYVLVNFWASRLSGKSIISPCIIW
jgi:hypothetical protein